MGGGSDIKAAFQCPLGLGKYRVSNDILICSGKLPVGAPHPLAIIRFLFMKI